MGARRDGAWHSRYEAAKAEDEAGNAAWVRSHFGGSVTQTLAKELPWIAFLALVGLVTLGWQAAVVNVVLLLVVVLGFRAWARRRYGVRG
ncbi:hypothetical protein [Geodermatophilus sp. FMUSA9-8]|uniref:hypothetical protein n=1 Tax=Geodermatophilus sp. FMUSA9-8 TaxID=3120155 RepID=UPI003008DF6C